MHRQVEIKATIKKYLPQWNNVSSDHIRLQRMTGITNETYKASADPVHHESIPPIIFRKLGDSANNIFLQREAEIYVYLHVAAEGNGPKIFHHDNDLRLEEYIESYVLPAGKMLDSPYLEEVAFALRKFHQLQPPSDRIPKKSLIKRIMLDGKEKILGLIHNKMRKNIFSPDEQKLIELLKSWITVEELNFIEEATSKLEEEGLVFSHNDLLANNILISKAKESIVFIDYEYASYNYPIFDIANYMCESQFNYDVSHPPYFQVIPPISDAAQRQGCFIEAYVVSKDLSLPEFRENFNQLRGEQRFKKEIDHLKSLLPFGKMLCQMLWGWWAILVCKNPEITFDYLAYSKRRYDQYQRWKKHIKQQ